MTNLNEVYKCSVCGNMVEVVHSGVGTLVCCGKPMELQTAKTEDPVLGEKHVPVIEKTETGILVKVGAIPHPMEEAHHIEWIEIWTAEGKICKKYLKPGDKPEILFHPTTPIFEIRAYCNIHGLWKSEI